MDFKKIFTSKIGIAIIFVVITILAVLGFSVICKRGGSYMFKDSRGKVNKYEITEGNDVVDVTKKDGLGYLSAIYCSNYNKNIDAIFKYDSYKYHIVIDKDSNVIKVDDKTVFGSSEKIFNVYMIKDILVIQETNSYMKDNLYFVDMNGNVIKTFTGIAHNSILVTDSNVKYFVEKCNYSENDIYKLCSADAYIISYLGDKRLSDSTIVDQEEWSSNEVSSCSMESCIIYDKNNIKIEYSSYNDKYNLGTMISVNGNSINLDGYRLDEIKFTNDNYLYISCSSGTGAGRPAYFLIADLNGNAITTMDERSLVDVDMYNYFTSFEDSKIVYDTVQEGSSVELVCEKMLGINEFDSPVAIKSYDDIAYVKNEYNYIGNGKVSRVNRVEKTFGNYMKELTGYDNCQDAINNIDSWKSKDDIYKFYGVK